MLTFSPILAQKVDFISKREQNQDSFFPGDILKIYIIGLNLKRKRSQNFHMVRTSILVTNCFQNNDENKFSHTT